MAAPYGNKNAEKWTLRKAVELFHEAIELTNEKETVEINGRTINGYKYDFIGEIAGELGTFKEIFAHLTKRFSVLQRVNNQLHTNIERNCYSNGKKGAIKEASAIMNLKSNHKWTDRVDNTGSVTNLNYNTSITKEEAREISDALEDEV